MATILTDSAKSIVEKLKNMKIAKTSYVCCFPCIVEDFEKEKEKLKAKRTTVGEYVEEARRAEAIRSDVTFWEGKADKLIKEDTKTKMTCFFGWCPNCKWRYRRGKELAEMTNEIRSLMEENIQLDNVGFAPHIPGVEYHSSRDYIPFKSRELKYKVLLGALTDDNNYITGLQGMGGTGKTTLAKEVGKELQKSGQFDKVIYTTVSYTPDIKKIQDDIAGPLGLALKDYGESKRSKILWSRLTNGEKILLILDDVWAPINFEEIGIPYSNNHKGFKVLLTTRNERVCISMGCEKIIQLELLYEEDAWTLFKMHAGISDSSSESLLDKGRKIAKECKGLPVAIAAIASTLKGQQSQEEWKAALTSLKDPMPMHGVDENLIEVYKCLRYSYDNLKDGKAKQLFLLCSMFQEDEEIDTEILIRLGVGVGLFGEFDDKYDEARRRVFVAKNKLIDSCLLMMAEEGHVKMHNLVRETALWIANKKIQAVKLSNKNQKSLVQREKNIKYLLCEGKGMDVFSCRLDGSNLKILVVYIDGEDSVEAPDSFFENMTELRVLYLSQKDWGLRDLSLPQSIQSLTNIRSLFLESFKLGDISILGTLRSLETLDLVGCSIIELPREITELTKLRLLNLYWCEIGRNNPFEVIERCSSLEELYFIGIKSILLNCIADDPEAIHHNRTLPALQRYRLIEDEMYDKRNDSISKCVCLSDIDALFSKATFKYLVQRAEILQLERIKEGWRNLIPEIVPIDEGMNDLVELRLESCSELQCLIDTSHIYSHVQSVFSKLVGLRLEGMDKLEELCNGPLPFDLLKSLEKLRIIQCGQFRSELFKSKLNLCNLKTMKLDQCPMLVSLFQLSTSRSLVLLEKLKIYNCEQLKNIITDERTGEETGEEIVDGDNDNKSRGSMFPNLRTLDIRGCHQLEFIFPVLSAGDVPVLEAIKIDGCGELKYMFGQYQHEHEHQDLQVKDVVLGSLEKMELSGLPNFTDIFPEFYHPMCSSLKRTSSRDGSKVQIQSDTVKYNVFSWTRYAHKYRHKLRSTTSTNVPLASKDQSQDCSISLASNSECLQLWERAQCLSKQSLILRNIKEIELNNFLKIKSVFILSLAPKMLETLTIQDCGELKHIIIDIGDDRGGNNWDDAFPKLKKLYVKGCGQLEYIFGHYTHDHQNDNEIHLHLPALKLLGLSNLPNLINICPKNYRTTLPVLTEFVLEECSQFTVKSIGDMMVHLDSGQLDSTTTKDLSENVKHFLTLENLRVYNSEVENIFSLNEIIGKPMNLGLQKVNLFNLTRMMYLFVGPKNSFTLQNLTSLRIERCKKMEVIFSASISRCLPQLHNLWIRDCKELKQIIEEDLENQKMSNLLSPKTCFPELTVLVVEKCNKLKCVFPVSTSKELTKLQLLIIKEASQLEEVFGFEQGDQKVELPNLKIVLFVQLPSLCQGIDQLQTLKGRLVQNCPKVSLTSTLTVNKLQDIISAPEDFEMDWLSWKALQDTINELLEHSKTTEEFPVGPEVQATSGCELPSSQVNTNQSMEANLAEYNQHENVIDSNEFSSVGIKTKWTPEEEKEFVDKVPGLEIPSIAISSADSELIIRTCPSPLDIPLHQTHSHELLDEQSIGEPCLMNQQKPLGENDITDKTPQGNNCLEEIEDQSIQEGSTSEKTVAATLSIDSETRNTSPGPLLAPLQKRIKRSVEEGTTSENAKIITSSTHSELIGPSPGPLVTSERKTYPQEDGDGQIAIPSFSVVIAKHPTTKDVDVKDSQETSGFVVAHTETHAPVSLNDDAPMKVSSIIEEGFSNDDDIGVSESKASPIIPSPIASQSPSVPMNVLLFEGNPSQIEEDLGFASLVTKELEQLVCEKHLASENLSLLTDFLLKNPSLRLIDNSLSNKYKGFAYNCLAELLKFLQTHSVLDVMGSSHSDFVELLQDLRSFAFDKDWLDGVARRALFPGLQVSQEALQKLLDSKQRFTQEVEELRLKVGTLKHKLESFEAVLESVIQQETQVLEARAALSAPLGY